MTRLHIIRVVAGGAVVMIAAAAVAFAVAAVPAAAAIPPLGTSQVPQGEPRYTVEVQSFKALDEGGVDFWDSDEVFGVFDSTRGFQTATSLYRQVDRGDRINLPRLERCLAPQRVISGETHGLLWAPGDRWDCDPRGVPAPIGVNLELWEDEGCNPFIPSCFDGYNGGPIDSADVLIGRAEATYTAAQLASRLRTVRSTLLQVFKLGGPCGHQEPNHVCGTGPFAVTGPEYEVVLSIHRVSDAPLRATQE